MGRGAARKMHAVDQRVGADRELMTGGNSDDRRVVADSGAHILARDRAAFADQVDEIEFAQTQFLSLNDTQTELRSRSTAS